MNYIDPIIIILLAWAAYRGFKKGLVIMVSAFVALIIGIWGAVKFSGLVGRWMAETLHVSTPYLSLVSFTITFIVIVILVNIAAVLVSRLLDAIALGFVNRLLGGVFSVLTMALVMSVFFVILNAFDRRHDFMPEKQIEESMFYKPVADFAPKLFPFLHFKEIVREIENLLVDSTSGRYPFSSPKGPLKTILQEHDPARRMKIPGSG